MTPRNLMFSLALALSAACAIDIPSQTPCQDVNGLRNDGLCPTGQVCGDDLFCRENKACPTGQTRCTATGVCTDPTTNLNCGGCAGETGVACKNGEFCSLNSATNKYACSAFCSAGFDVCTSGAEVACRDLKTDRLNCGICGNACPDSKPVCAPNASGKGTCGNVCPTGLDLCGTSCVDRTNDSKNCGSCGNTCGAGQACQGGVCKTSCQAGLTECTAGKCYDTSADSQNCGGCGLKCGAGLVCKNSTCSLTCATGLSVCGSTCVNSTSDSNNCGGCTTGTIKSGPSKDNFACDPGFSCKPQGAGNSGVCVIDCPTGQNACGSSCFDFTRDSNNCGGCGIACGAGQTCSGSHCVLSCGAGQVACNGACVNTTSDRANCGGCTTGTTTTGPSRDNFACAAGQVCGNSACSTSCPAGQTNCGGSCVNLSTDGNNCGACTTGSVKTGAGKNNFACDAGFVCGNGNCQLSCPAGSIPCNGVCTDPTHDNANCGGCNAGCAAGTSCQPVTTGGSTTGQCKADCGGNLTACGSSCKDTQNDPANCGACGHGCNSGESCVAGQCKVVCATGLTACAQTGGGTACKDLQNDAANCGACGGVGGSQPCGAGQICKAGQCTLTCPSGTTPCGGTCVNTAVDPANCGSCSASCGPYANASAYCSASTCAASCTGSFADCDGNPATGCETDLSSDATHCGGCLNACKAPDNATALCSSSTCGSSCKANFNDCDTDKGNGCESNSNNDAANCGACGNDCSLANGGTQAFCTGKSCTSVFTGVEQNVSVAALSAAGWTQCYLGTYSDTVALSTLQTSCNGTSVLMGCRLAGASRLTVAASGLRADVFFATGASATHSAPGSVSFYFDTASSWGFAPATASVNRSACDVAGGAQDQFAAGFGTQRLCWLTNSSNLSAGGRCGDKESPGSAYERVLFTKP